MGELLFFDIQNYIEKNDDFVIQTNQSDRVEKAYSFLNEFSLDKVIYGINTGFGPMAQYRIEDSQLNTLQYNLVRSHANGTGTLFSEREVRSIMICRLNTLALGKSGVSLGVVKTLEAFIKAEVYPNIYEHGSVGASGDLVQLAHLALGLIGEGMCSFQGQQRLVSDVLAETKIAPLQLQLRDGLALINGTSCMTGVAITNLIDAKQLVDTSILLSSAINEILESYDDSFSSFINNSKMHKGQRDVAQQMRDNLSDSKLIKRREEHLYAKTDESQQKVFKNKVQEYYSIRCVPQIIGPVVDTISSAIEVIQDEVNSANDNPLTDVENENVFHGGNFHGDYVALEMDKLKIAITKLCMLMERQLNFLMNAKLNEKFPPFLNKGTLGLNFGLQGLVFSATSTTAECQTLANPMYVHSIPCNNDNQDVVSMGTNAAVLARKVIANTYEVQAILSASIAQAIDIADNKENLSSSTVGLYQKVRSVFPCVEEDVPMFKEVEELTKILKRK